MTARAPGGRDPWLALGEASRILGITPATLRRWADDGRVPVFTTPGGHRRFTRTAIAAMLPAPRTQRPSLARLGASPERVARAYRARRRVPGAGAPWVETLDASVRTTFRERGRELVTALLAALDDPDAPAGKDRLQDAKQLAAAHGRELAELGLTLADAVEAFLRFRSPFTETLVSLARRRGLDTREATELLTRAEADTDALLVAVMTGHSLATGERAHRARTSRSARTP